MDRVRRTSRFRAPTIAVALLCVATASAQERERGQRREHGDRGQRDLGQMIKRMDADGDGKISKDEFTGPERLFERLDADGDGFITEEELASMRQRRGGLSFRDDGAPKVGDGAPAFKLKSLDGKQEFDLASFRGRRRVVLFFGSYT